MINLNSYKLYEEIIWGLIYLSNLIYSVKHVETKCIHTLTHTYACAWEGIRGFKVLSGPSIIWKTAKIIISITL